MIKLWIRGSQIKHEFILLFLENLRCKCNAILSCIENKKLHQAFIFRKCVWDWNTAVEHFLAHKRLWIWSSALEEKKRKPNRYSFDCSDLQTFSTEVLPGNALLHEKLLRASHKADFLSFSSILSILTSLLFPTYWVWASLGTMNQR